MWSRRVPSPSACSRPGSLAWCSPFTSLLMSVERVPRGASEAEGVLVVCAHTWRPRTALGAALDARRGPTPAQGRGSACVSHRVCGRTAWAWGLHAALTVPRGRSACRRHSPHRCPPGLTARLSPRAVLHRCRVTSSCILGNTCLKMPDRPQGGRASFSMAGPLLLSFPQQAVPDPDVSDLSPADGQRRVFSLTGSGFPLKNLGLLSLLG